MKSYLMHHGILGQKWGVRRYQNEDGSLTAAGKKHVGVGDDSNDHNLKKNGGGIKGYFERKKASREELKGIKQEAKKLKNEAAKKSQEEYDKALGYADKHKLDYDDYIFEDERSDMLKNYKKYGVSEEKMKHIIEYSRLTDIASVKEEEYYLAAKNKVNEMMKNRKYK